MRSKCLRYFSKESLAISAKSTPTEGGGFLDAALLYSMGIDVRKYFVYNEYAVIRQQGDTGFFHRLDYKGKLVICNDYL